mgnify:CR=1 FL=1
MAASNNKKEKYLIENLLSSQDLFSRCASIIRPEYFDHQEYQQVIKFVIEYHEKYGGVPDFNAIEAELDVELTPQTVTTDSYKYLTDEIEDFCKEEAVKLAVYNNLEKLNSADKCGEAVKAITDATLVSLEKDMGLELYDNPEETLYSLIEEFTPTPIGINAIDEKLGGGIIRRQMTLISANSGGGKSVMLSNIGANFSRMGYDVLYISLELDEGMVYLRLASIVSEVSTRVWKTRIPEMSAKIIQEKEDGAGRYTLKKLPNGSTANDIKSYLKHYELEYGKAPDMLIVDYLDLMHPIGGIRNTGVYEQDKQKSEELSNLIGEYDMFCCTASQQNREMLRMSTPDQSGIAGGISKVNTVDNYISLFMSDEMRLAGEMYVHFLKTRSSSGHGKSCMLHFNEHNLVISDGESESTSSVLPKKSKKEGGTVKDIIQGLDKSDEDGSSSDTTDESDKSHTEDELTQFVKEQREKEEVETEENEKDNVPSIHTADKESLEDFMSFMNTLEVTI